MAVRKNPDGSVSVGILDDFAKDMNPPEVVEEIIAEAVETAEKKPVKTTKKPVKTAKK